MSMHGFAAAHDSLNVAIYTHGNGTYLLSVVRTIILLRIPTVNRSADPSISNSGDRLCMLFGAKIPNPGCGTANCQGSDAERTARRMSHGTYQNVVDAARTELNSSTIPPTQASKMTGSFCF